MVALERLAAGDVLHQRSRSARKRSTVRVCRASSSQRLTDDLAGQLDRDPAEVGPQLGDDLRTLGVELRPTGRGDPLGLGVRLGEHVVADGLGLGPRVLADLGGLLPGTGQLLVVAIERGLGLVLGLFGLRDATLDGLGPSGVRLLELRPDELAQHDEQQREGDGRDEDLAPGQADRVGDFLSRAAEMLIMTILDSELAGARIRSG